MKGPTETHVNKYFQQLDTDVKAITTAAAIVKDASNLSLAKLSFGLMEGTPSFAYSTEIIIQADEFELLQDFLGAIRVRREANREIVQGNRSELISKAKEMDGCLLQRT